MFEICSGSLSIDRFLRLKCPNIVKDMLYTILLQLVDVFCSLYLKANGITGMGDCIADPDLTRESKEMTCVCVGAVVFLTQIGHDRQVYGPAARSNSMLLPHTNTHIVINAHFRGIFTEQQI